MSKPRGIKLEDLDFEVSFYEDLIKDKPDFIDALMLLGEAYTKRGFYRKGLNIDKQLVKLKPNDPIVNYNLACSYSLIGDTGSSIKALKNALKKGYWDLDYMKKDPDLENVRKDRRFKDLIAKWSKERGGDINDIWLAKEKEKGKKVKKESGRKKKDYKKTKTAKEKRDKQGKDAFRCPQD